MTDANETRSGFLGTYYNPTTVLRLSSASKILAWIVLAVYSFQLLISLAINILQILRGFWVGMGVTDIVQNFLFIFQQPLQGVVYFAALLGVSQMLLILMDIEDNTRRAARK